LTSRPAAQRPQIVINGSAATLADVDLALRDEREPLCAFLVPI